MREGTCESAWRFTAQLQQYLSEMTSREIMLKRLSQFRADSQHIVVCFLAMGLLLIIFLPVLRAANDPSSSTFFLTIAQYEAELDRLSSASSRLADHPNEIKTLRESLPSDWVVAAEGGQFQVSAEWIASSLKDMEENLSERKKRSAELSAQIRQLRREAERSAGATQSVDGGGVRERLQRILSGREYQTVRSKSWLSRIWEQVDRWIDWILDHTVGRLVESGPARTLILWTLIVGVLLVIAIWVVRILMRMARTEALRVDGSFPPGRNWRDWAQQALSSARSGDYRAALHSAYWSGVYKLADLGAWQIDSARTPREYLRILSSHPATAVSFPAPDAHPTVDRLAALTSLTRSMESAWYGYTPATQKDFEAAMENLETLGCKLGSTAQTANS
jgi:hypothetical protein